MRALLPIVTGVLCLCLVASSLHAGSALVLPPPHALGPIPAGTYDDDGNRLGEATLFYGRTPDGKIHMRAVSSMQDGPRNMINAFGIEWQDDSQGNNGHFAPFDWQGEAA